MLAFCVLANVYIVPICIIDGALSMFSKQGCVPDIRPRECIKKYCPYTPPREQVMSFNIIPAVLIIKKGPEIKQSSRVDIFVDLGKLNYCIGIHLNI